MDRDLQSLKKKVAAAKKGGSMAGLNVIDAQWALDKIEEYEQLSILAPTGSPQYQDDVTRISSERDRVRRDLGVAVAALKDILKKLGPMSLGGRVAKAALQEIGES